jgi:hypothetical protein
MKICAFFVFKIKAADMLYGGQSPGMRPGKQPVNTLS